MPTPDIYSPVTALTKRERATLSASPAFWRMLAEIEDDPALADRYRRNEEQAALVEQRRPS